MRQTISTLRYVNDELVRAHEAISLRPPAAAPPSPAAGASARSATRVAGGAEAAATGHTGRAA